MYLYILNQKPEILILEEGMSKAELERPPFLIKEIAVNVKNRFLKSLCVTPVNTQ